MKKSINMRFPSTTKFKVMLAIALTAVFTGAARADVIMDWNAKADAIAAEKQILPAPHSRSPQIVRLRRKQQRRRLPTTFFLRFTRIRNLISTQR
jgi:hypothetical protein